MIKLTDVPGIGPATVKLLAEHKIKTVEALAAISLTDLKKISGFNGDIRAQAVKKAAADCLKNEIPENKAVANQVHAPTEIKKITKDKKNTDKKEKNTQKKGKKKNKNEKKKKKNKKDKKK